MGACNGLQRMAVGVIRCRRGTVVWFMRASFSRVALCGLAVFTLLAANAAMAQMYKWVDERGRVTYTNVPPPDSGQRGKLETIVPVTVEVSTYSSAESLGKGAIAQQERNLASRVEQLERELAAERQARSNAQIAALQASQAAENRAAAEARRQRELRERCLADRRVDCDSANLDEPAPAFVAAYPRVVRQVIVQPVYVHPVRPHPPHPSKPPAHEHRAQDTGDKPLHVLATLSTPPPLLSHPARPWAVPAGASLVVKSGTVSRW